MRGNVHSTRSAQSSICRALCGSLVVLTVKPFCVALGLVFLIQVATLTYGFLELVDH
jgi:hypothetical protein